MAKSLNKSLHQAKKAKKDEFYTQLNDISNELKHYKHYFKDKVVYCNCDDPRISKFFHHFAYSFEHLGLKKLITTCYKNKNPDLFSDNESEKAIYLEYKRDSKGALIPYPEYMKMIGQEHLYKGEPNNPNVPKPEDIGIGVLKGDGDFRSTECMKLLEQADIVVTNPPFSLFREYLAQLIEYDKKFLIIGNMNALKYQEIFPLIRDNKVWLGINSVPTFKVPDYYEANNIEIVDNERVAKMGNVIWYTNLEHKKRNEKLIIVDRYTPEKYPKYDNYNAINVDKVIDIPIDYDEVMGVPISFMDKYNPDQFEIIGYSRMHRDGSLNYLKNPKWTDGFNDVFLNGKQLYARIFIKNKKVKQ